MARKVLVRLVDDLDGMPSEDVATVTFSLDGATYQIDLNQANATRLRDGLARFVAAARRTGGRARRGTAARAAGNDGPAIREWARENGHELAERGRIPSHVVAEYRAATKGGRPKAETVTATVRPARTRTPKPAAKTPAKTAAASRAAKTTTAKTTTAKAAQKKTAGAGKAAKSAQPKAAKAPRSAASTAGGQRGRRATRSR